MLSGMSFTAPAARHGADCLVLGGAGEAVRGCGRRHRAHHGAGHAGGQGVRQDPRPPLPGRVRTMKRSRKQSSLPRRHVCGRRILYTFEWQLLVAPSLAGHAGHV